MVGALTSPAVETLTPPIAAAGCTAGVVTDYGEFLALETEWNDAVARAGIPHPFLRHEWLRTWWDCFGGDCRLHIIVVRSGSRIVGIAPLLADTMHAYGMTVRRIRLLQNDHTPRADFIVTDQPDAVYRAIWTALEERRDDWDLCQLNQIVGGSPTIAAMSGLANARGCRTGLWQSSDSPYLELAANWERYYSGLSGKFRQNLRNRLGRLTRLGEPSIETIGDRESIPAALDDAFRLEASGWKSGEGTAINADDAVRRFYTLLADRAAEHGWLRLLFLTANGNRIATSYSAQFDHRLFLIKTGYDPSYAQCSPFKLLAYFTLQQAYADGLNEVDFLGDAEPWKLEWTPTARRHQWLYVFGDTARARLLHRAKFTVAPVLKRWSA